MAKGFLAPPLLPSGRTHHRIYERKHLVDAFEPKCCSKAGRKADPHKRWRFVLRTASISVAEYYGFARQPECFIKVLFIELLGLEGLHELRVVEQAREV